MSDYIGKRIVPKHCGEWDRAKAYEMLSIVLHTENGESYGLDDAGLDATDADIERIKVGQVPQSLLSDAVHYTAATKTVIGTMLYKKMVELGILG